MLLIVRVALLGVLSIALTAPALAASVTVDGLSGAGSTGTEAVTDGQSLWSLTGGAAGFTLATYPSGYNTKNEILQYYVVASGSSGSSVFSLGELSGSGFGNSTVNIQNSGGQVSLVDPSAAARNVTNLTSLQILAVSAVPTGPGGQSTSVTVVGGSQPGNYNLGQLQSLPAVQVTPAGSPTYTGTPLSTLLGLSSFALASILNDIVITQGTDGYEVVLAAAELDPDLGGNSNDILAYASTGTDFPGDGIARTIFPTDSKHGRWESNLDEVELASATPLPAALPLFTGGLGMIGWIASRRRHKGKASGTITSAHAATPLPTALPSSPAAQTW
jgi:hypothetical protein